MNGKEQVQIVGIKKDVDYLKDDVKEVKKDVKDIKDNHLPHIWKKIDNLDKRVSINHVKITIYVSIIVAIITFITKHYF